MDPFKVNHFPSRYDPVRHAERYPVPTCVRTAALRSGRSHSRFAGRPHRETRTFRSLHLRLSRPYLCSFPFPRLLLSSPRRPHCRLVKPSSLALEGTPEKKLYTRLRLWQFPDKYVLEPIDGTAESFLSISRFDGSINLIGELSKCSATESPNVRTIYGVIGMLKLLVGAYLLVITERESIGSYLGHAIYRVSGMQILPCNHSLNNSSAEQKTMEAEFSVLLNAAEGTSGYQNFQAAIGPKVVDVTLIARRCTRRTGTRMWRRGADMEGYVANFVESEQILQSNGFTASFVQVRGSMPFLWEQIVDLTYKPKFEIVRAEEASRVAERHFLDLSNKYGSVLAVDLVNKHGSEGRLSERFANAMQTIRNDDIRYVHFDFHQICGHIHFERLSLLYNQIEDYLNKHGYFLLNEKGEKVSGQTGVVRTNCIDCLDRTNVTQSMIARKALESQLKQIGIFGSDDSISAYPYFDASYKILWANHGDHISIQYSGTPALKGDFVRYGKRTVQGILKDGWNAMARYYLNNFVDGTKQDAIDLLQGHYIVSLSRDMSSPTKAGALETYASFRLALALVLTGLMFALMSLRQAQINVRHILLSLVWASLSLGIAAFVRANGRLFTNRPRLLRSKH
ncbi:SacI domain [Musa troglodytarum]|uniref:SacI domain n=1 Tax=Musa troglodytarum TaxID=320322 RepID=A0A9E7FUE2_9LILI|nr:SacI domain [Musa troglodytarum]